MIEFLTNLVEGLCALLKLLVWPALLMSFVLLTLAMAGVGDVTFGTALMPMLVWVVAFLAVLLFAVSVDVLRALWRRITRNHRQPWERF